jgi:hypothetical protein
MSAIFKSRKTPKHLILGTLPEPGRRWRFTWVWQLLGLALLLSLTAAVVYLPQA